MTKRSASKPVVSQTRGGLGFATSELDIPIPPHPHTPIPTVLLSLLIVYFVVYGGAFATSLTAVGKIQGQIITALLWALLIIALVRKKEVDHLFQSARNPVLVLMGLLAVSLLVSARLSFFPRFSLEVAFQSIWYLGLAWLTYLYCRTEEHRERIVTAVLVGGVVVLTFALIQFAGWLFNPHRDTSPAGQRVMTATMNSHNDLAGYLVLLWPLALGRFLPTDRGGDSTPASSVEKVLPPFYALLALLILFAIIFTYSRCGWVGAVAEVFAFGVLSILTGQSKTLVDLIRSQKVIVVGVILLLLAAIFLSPHQWFLVRVRTMLTASDYGSTSRLTMWRHLAQMWRDRPVWGWGPGLLPIVYPRYLHVGEIRELIFHAHNIVLQYAVDGGAVALALFLATLAVGFKQTLRGVDPEKNVEVARRQTALMTALIGFFVYSLFNCTQAIPAITGTFWILLGVMSSQQKSIRAMQSPTRWKAGFKVAVVCCLLLCYASAVIPMDEAQLLFDGAMRLSDKSAQIALLNEVISKDDDFWPYYWTRDILLFRKGQVPDLRVQRPEDFDKYGNGVMMWDEHSTPYTKSNDALTWNDRATMLARITRGESVMLGAAFNQCIALDPTLPQYRMSSAVVSLRMKEWKKAEEQLTAITTKLASKPPVTWLFLAQIHETRGEWQKAHSELEEGLRQAKLHVNMPGYQMRIRYRRLGLENESVDALPDLYSEDLLNWELGKVLNKLGQKNEAKKYRAEAIRLNPKLKVEPPRGYVWEYGSVGGGKSRPMPTPTHPFTHTPTQSGKVSP